MKRSKRRGKKQPQGNRKSVEAVEEMVESFLPEFGAMVSRHAALNNAVAEKMDGKSFVGWSGFWFARRRSRPIARYDVQSVLV